MNCGKVFWLTRLASTSTNAMVADLSASGSAPNTASIAPGPTSFSRAIAFCVAGLDGSVADRISVTSRSARKFVKKLIQPFRGEPLLHVAAAPPAPEHYARQGRNLSGPASRGRDRIVNKEHPAFEPAGLCHSLEPGHGTRPCARPAPNL